MRNLVLKFQDLTIQWLQYEILMRNIVLYFQILDIKRKKGEVDNTLLYIKYLGSHCNG